MDWFDFVERAAAVVAHDVESFATSLFVALHVDQLEIEQFGYLISERKCLWEVVARIEESDRNVGIDGAENVKERDALGLERRTDQQIFSIGAVAINSAFDIG